MARARMTAKAQRPTRSLRCVTSVFCSLICSSIRAWTFVVGEEATVGGVHVAQLLLVLVEVHVALVVSAFGGCEMTARCLHVILNKCSRRQRRGETCLSWTGNGI